MAVEVTEAQLDALEVLAKCPAPDRRARSWKRRSTLEPVPTVNRRAADALVDKGLATWWHPDWHGGRDTSLSCAYSDENQYAITVAGLEVLRPPA